MIFIRPLLYGAACGVLLVGLVVSEVVAKEPPPDEPMSVWFDQPGRTFHDSCVLGNGRLGAMDLGGVNEDRIVLNESSLWSGGPYDGNRYDAHQCLPDVREKLFAGDVSGAGATLARAFRYADGVNGWADANQFGCYQTLGRLILSFGSIVPEIKVSSPSGHAEGDGKPIANSIDGDSGTKWCVDKAGTAVVWQIELAEETTVSTYALTSADDVPTRDPQVWVLEGSVDGKTWTELDRRNPGKPFESRFQTKTFDIAKPAPFRFYRFTFTPQETYFQVAEIALDGVNATASVEVPFDYRRDLNLMTGVATTRYTHDGVVLTRELVVSKPDEVIALRLTASQPGAISCTAALERKQDVTFRAEGNVHVMEGQLKFNKPGGGGQGMRYLALLGVNTRGGKVSATQQGVTIEGADEATLIVSAGTDWINKDYAAVARKRFTSALAKSFTAIRDDAVADHRRYMERVELILPEGPNSKLPTPERVSAQERTSDPALARALLSIRAPPCGLRFAARLAVADQSAGHLGRGI